MPREAESPAASPGRRDAIDVARVLALVIVVLGHLLLAVIDRPAGSVRGANLLALYPGWAALGALSPMPVFFAAAGWANAGTTPAGAAARLRTLVGLGAVVVCAWSLAVVAAEGVSGSAGVVGDGARIATQPLWFVAAYAPFAAAGSALARLGARRFGPVLGSSLVLLALADVARFRFGAGEWIAWPGFFLAWGAPWVAGAWWRARREASPGFDERRVGAAMFAAAAAGCVLLVAFANYDPALIDAVPGARSNTTPPTLYTAVAGLAQVGLLLVLAAPLDRIGHRWRRLWDRAGEAAVGVYVWHLSALALCAAVIAAGLPVPERLTVAWWVSRPVWWAAVLAVAAGFVAVTATARARLDRRERRAAPGLARVVLGVAVAASGGAYVGLRGPRSAVRALLASALFVTAWVLLRPGRGVHARPDGSVSPLRAGEP